MSGFKKRWLGNQCRGQHTHGSDKISKFFIRWHVDNSKMPAAPEETGKLLISMLETVEAGLHTGKLNDWGQLGNGQDGYAISELSEEALFVCMVQWMPFITFEVFPVVSADQSMEALDKAVAALQSP